MDPALRARLKKTERLAKAIVGTTLTPTEYEALEAFRKIAGKLPGEWVPAYRVAGPSQDGGRLAQALRRLARKGILRINPEADYYYRLSEAEELEAFEAKIAAADGRLWLVVGLARQYVPPARVDRTMIETIVRSEDGVVWKETE